MEFAKSRVADGANIETDEAEVIDEGGVRCAGENGGKDEDGDECKPPSTDDAVTRVGV